MHIFSKYFSDFFQKKPLQIAPQWFFYAIYSLWAHTSGHTRCALCRYFSFVAIPPRIWRSDLLTSNTFLACVANAGLIFESLSVTSLCTVDLDTPNAPAVCLTVAL